MIELQDVHRHYAMAGQTVRALVGLAFGVYAARQAAQLDPIAALRQE